MTSLERAKRLIQQKGKAIALTIVPLAAATVAAMPANAGVIFNPGSCSVTHEGPAVPSGSCSLTALPTGPNGVTGVSLSGSLFGSPDGSGSFGFAFDGSGTASGSIGPSGGGGGPIAVAWDFSTSGLPADWILDVFINGGQIPVLEAFGSAPGGQVTGSDTLQLGGAIASYRIVLDFNAEFGSQGTFSADVPAGKTIDINPLSETSVPEPSAWALAGSALASLLWKRRRKSS